MSMPNLVSILTNDPSSLSLPPTLGVPFSFLEALLGWQFRCLALSCYQNSLLLHGKRYLGLCRASRSKAWTWASTDDKHNPDWDKQFEGWEGI